MMHYPPVDFEDMNLGPCVCGCGQWLVWDEEAEEWTPEPDPYRFYIVDPEYKPEGDTIIGLIVEREYE